MKIAMWSGPRNLSTAMMYAFGNRADFAAVDEPFYAAYLTKTGFDHPMRDVILAAQSHDPSQVIDGLVGPNPNGAEHYYQKHMSQHMITGVSRAWIGQVTNLFLIRHPARVTASFSAKFEDPSLTDIGFVQQAELYDQLVSEGQSPVVIDSADIRNDPEGMLRKLCDAIGLAFDPAMLSWPAVPKPFDGAWADHWYGSVHASTGFAGGEGPLPNLQGRSAELAAAALPSYRKLEAVKLT